MCPFGWKVDEVAEKCERRCKPGKKWVAKEANGKTIKRCEWLDGDAKCAAQR